jgi:hypothetical protein
MVIRRFVQRSAQTVDQDLVAASRIFASDEARAVLVPLWCWSDHDSRAHHSVYAGINNDLLVAPGFLGEQYVISDTDCATEGATYGRSQQVAFVLPIFDSCEQYMDAVDNLFTSNQPSCGNWVHMHWIAVPRSQSKETLILLSENLVTNLPDLWALRTVHFICVCSG